jgi:anti-anti-sigma factor
MMHFNCTIEQRPDTVLVHPSGEVDRDTAPDLRRCLTEAIHLAGARTVEVDLALVTFMDSSGIGALLAGHRLARDTDVPFRIRDAGPAVRTVLELTNVWDLLRA